MILKEYLYKNNISNKVFASKIGVNPSYVSQLKRGYASPSLTIINRIFEATNYEVSSLDLSPEEVARVTESQITD